MQGSLLSLGSGVGIVARSACLEASDSLRIRFFSVFIPFFSVFILFLLGFNSFSTAILSVWIWQQCEHGCVGVLPAVFMSQTAFVLCSHKVSGGCALMLHCAPASGFLIKKTISRKQRQLQETS